MALLVTSIIDTLIGTKPFVLWLLPEEECHICPVRALAQWIHCSKIEEGYIFRGIRVTKADEKILNSSISSSVFLELFRNMLVDIRKDPFVYGTHSLRRGGCQWLAREKRWPIPKICGWGGWSSDLTNLTIVRYLLSWNDDPYEAREDFFNPSKVLVVHCPHCRRNCAC
ncbi:hypothetical protein F5887DRAFT_891801 [Amanita rubescens]|nr:hypothetical protein F5887DRAFT_891801 [Amanita rubescens]